jgi:UDP-N-acetylglucosamine 1-carboxyvinyltransferase
MDQLIIEGGHPLKGSVSMSGSKNAALPILAATLLTGGEVTLRNVPRLRDVNTFLRLLEDLGSTIRHGPDGITLDSSNLSSLEAPYDLVRTMRASILVLGPLAARMGEARVSLPGGCAIGARPIDFHLKGLEHMGARLRLKKGYIEARAARLKGAQIYFDIPSVTGTENLMMAGVLARGTTVLKNAAKEPEVVALGQMLIGMGAKIKGLGTETIQIEGVRELNPVDWSIIPDRIETGTYIMAAGACGGELEITDARPEHLQAVIAKLRNAGLEIEEGKASIHVCGNGRLKSVDIKTLPFPGFPTDLQAQMMALMTLASGLSVITETIFENRFMHVAELRRLGADIKAEGRSCIIRGVEDLHGAPVMATDLRASASLVLASLAAKGSTRISRVYHLDRGYENLEQKLSAVGACIRREKADSPY